MSKFRRPELTVVVGRKGIGKTYTTNKTLEQYVAGDPESGIKPRKVIIFDVNNEFTGVQTISVARAFEKEGEETEPNYILLFSTDKVKAQMRRVIPYHKNGKKMNIAELNVALSYILDNFYGGCVLIEDINKYVADIPKNDLTGSIATQRHHNCDMIIHYQYKSKACNPKILGFTRYLRIHKTGDTFRRNRLIENLGTEKYPVCQTAEYLVDMKNKELWNNATVKQKGGSDEIPVELFWVKVDFDRGKILGNFTKADLRRAVEKFVMANSKEALHEIITEIDLKTGEPKYTKVEAINIKTNELVEAYWPT